MVQPHRHSGVAAHDTLENWEEVGGRQRRKLGLFLLLLLLLLSLLCDSFHMPATPSSGLPSSGSFFNVAVQPLS